MLGAGPSSSGLTLDPQPGRRALLVSSALDGAEIEDRFGGEAYSYHFVQRAFTPLLERLGTVTAIDHPESRLDYAVRQARQRGFDPLHLSFQPLHATYLSSLAPNVAFPFWEFPDVPNEDFDDNPRNNWTRIAGQLQGILCASEFTRLAFVRAGVSTPITVVPVPIRDGYFALPSWEPHGRGCLDAHVAVQSREPRPRESSASPHLNIVERVHARLQYTLRATLPPVLDYRVGRLGQAVRAIWRETPYGRKRVPLDGPSLELSGVVYTSVLNPFDQRKNWQDLVSAFVLALRECDDATLVLKLVSSPTMRMAAMQRVFDYHAQLAIPHRCRVAVIPQYLADPQMLELTRVSTYCVTATRAEGACLPVQDFLAAGRPVVAPAHSALADYLRPDIAFVVDSHPEPTWWPHDRSERYRTTWHRLVWQSLHDQFQSSYRVAKHDPERYAAMARQGRARMRQFASPDAVWPRLQAALSGSTHGASAVR